MQNTLSKFQAIQPAVRRGITTAIALFLLATPLVAQGTPSPLPVDTVGTSQPVASMPVAPLAASLYPAASNTVPGWVTASSAVPAATTTTSSVRAADTRSTSRDAAMMIVGAAGLLAGGVVGGKAGTTLMVGGTVVGLIGLWNYMK